MVVRAKMGPAKSRQPDRLGELLDLPAYATMPITLVQYGEVVPLGVLVRGTPEWMLDEHTLERLSQKHAPEQ